MVSEPRMNARLKTRNSFTLNKRGRKNRAFLRGSTERKT